MSNQPAKPVLLLLGPTASGKTELAEALVDALHPHLPVRLVSMDSALVYRGMDIGTAKPSPAELARYPHALVDIRDPSEPFSAADFVRAADLEVQQAHDAGQLPVLVGGTMLYARAFRDGLADLPSADQAIRERLRQEAQVQGWPALHARLAAADPIAAAKIEPQNSQRLQRALEVLELTGKPLSWWWQQQSDQSAAARLGVRLVQAAIVPSDRALLHQRIEQRLDQMLAQGLVAEVAGLRARSDLSLQLPSIRAVGYRQVWEHLDGHYNSTEMRQRLLAATRQLAKRQLTWLRGWPEMLTLEPALNSEALEANVSAVLSGSELAIS
jgi:tRNA dimethylallyltransferase